MRRAMRLRGSSETAHRVGISLRQLYHWVNVLRVVRPRSFRHGSRVFRRFSERDIRTLKRVRALVRRGYTVRAAVRRVRKGS